MFYLTNGQTNTFAVYVGETLSTCTMRYTDLATMTAQTSTLTIVSQNERYAELEWEVSAAEGQYILELMSGETRLAAHVAYISNASGDPLQYNDYEFYEA